MIITAVGCHSWHFNPMFMGLRGPYAISEVSG